LCFVSVAAAGPTIDSILKKKELVVVTSANIRIRGLWPIRLSVTNPSGLPLKVSRIPCTCRPGR
jgi:hypothetical protein